MKRRGEGGFVFILAVPVALVTITVVTAPWWLPPIIKDIHDAPTWWQGKQQSAGPARVEYPVVAVDGPSGSETRRECVLRIAATHDLRWTGSGWESSRVPKEPLTGDPNKDRGTVRAWESQMISYVQTFSGDWNADCRDRDGPPVTQPVTTTTLPAASLNGTYAVAVIGSDCDLRITTATVSQSGGSVNIGLAVPPSTGSPGGTIPLTGSLRADGSFELASSLGSPQSITGQFTFKFSGRFEAFGASVSIQDGLLVVLPQAGPLSCTIRLTARR